MCQSDTHGGQLGHLAIQGTSIDRKVWITNSDVGNIRRVYVNEPNLVLDALCEMN